MIDARFQFGAFGAWQKDENPIEFGFQFPGTTSMYAFAFGPNASTQPGWIRRFHPITQGVHHRFWLPWISANRLHSITSLKKFDPKLYRQLSEGN